MLNHLEISDFALIERISIPLKSGLTVLTGETGAGKSILIDAIGCLLGERASRDLVRHQAKEATIDAVVSIPKSLTANTAFNEWCDGDGDQNDWLVTRTVSATGKSISRLNRHLITAGELKELMGAVVDIHGQHEQQSIFESKTQRRLLDSYGALTIEPLLQEWKVVLTKYRHCQNSLKELAIDPSERERQLDLLNYEIEEIGSVNWQEGELQKVQKRVKQLEVLSQIQDELNEAVELLDTNDETSGYNQIGRALMCLKFPAQYSQRLSTVQDQLSLVLEQLVEVRREIDRVIEKTEAKPNELEKLSKNLDARNHQLRKFGGTPEKVLAYYNQAVTRRNYLEDMEGKVLELTQEIALHKENLEIIGAKLSQARLATGFKLSRAITTELMDLDMKNVSIEIEIKRRSGGDLAYTEEGLDEVTWQIAPNLGEPAKPLGKIASGGEAARILLAVKTVLADVDNLGTLIFDEIDTGISGKTASKAAIKLRRLGEKRQVLCITHSAQIAAAAHNHLHIVKDTADGRTKTNVTELTTDLRLHEVARLLTGKPDDLQTLALARQMIDNIEQTN